ncbi:hypothetical protein Ccrd_004283 [Cynara cardunculus var. scolymus]|uniref:Uncharacterized protein n=1 Tax=Cynara cardunculus var. scolymus TaxID=59895 RepID=A0A103XMU3_CYNCS|nr:hypothetical protein Ccrd_004283 [Cynara cardunculus var. scolymus]
MCHSSAFKIEALLAIDIVDQKMADESQHTQRLHKADRGMHLYYLKVGTIEANPHHIVNLIHYKVLSPLYLN